MHWSFGKYWFTKLCRSSKCWHIPLYNRIKSCNITHLSHWVSLLVRGSLQALSGGFQSTKTVIFTSKLKFCHRQQILSAIFLKRQAHYILFQENVVILYNTGNSPQCCMVWMRGEFGGEWIHVYVWLSPFAFHLKLSLY